MLTKHSEEVVVNKRHMSTERANDVDYQMEATGGVGSALFNGKEPAWHSEDAPDGQRSLGQQIG